MLRVAIISLALVALGPLATRVGVVRFPVGMAMVALGSLGAVIAIAGAGVTAWRVGWTGGMTAFLVGIAALVVPVWQLLAAGFPPPIHDISTDLDDPPLFAALLPLRGDRASTPDYDGPEAAAAQRLAYPDIVPLTLGISPAEALPRAERAARALGWTVVATDASLGRFEATDTTFWFRFTDDVVVRVRAEGNGSRIDVRSKSRVGRGDLGKNARRIRAFFEQLRVTD